MEIYALILIPFLFLAGLAVACWRVSRKEPEPWEVERRTAALGKRLERSRSERNGGFQQRFPTEQRGFRDNRARSIAHEYSETDYVPMNRPIDLPVYSDGITGSHSTHFSGHGGSSGGGGASSSWDSGSSSCGSSDSGSSYSSSDSSSSSCSSSSSSD